ncbi:hypothetical protein RB653_005546 [Dictyostelium firmibasis]|uniref:EGF-like domain-containing protein n=1 Tax=Dictyostelium firmibasis TaxID=79012 RepID=A0AAN7Z4E6_9MYCE
MIKFIITIFIYSLFLISFIQGKTLDNSEKICLDNLVLNLGLNVGTNCSDKNIVNCLDGTYVYSLNLNSNSSYQISQQDFQCFSSISTVILTNLNVSPFFLVGPFPLKTISLINCNTTYSQLFLQEISSNLTALTIDEIPPQIFNVYINLSCIQKLSSFIFRLKNLDASTNNILLNNDLPVGVINNIPLLSIDLKDIPSMDNVNCSSINLRSFYTPTYQGYNNIPSLKNIQNIYLYISSGYSEFNQFSLIPKENSIESLFFRGSLLSRQTKVDLTNLTKLISIDLRDVFVEFNHVGQIPLILPQSVQSFSISGGEFLVSVKEFFDLYPAISFNSISYNQITGNFSEWKNRGYKSFFINNNKLEGSVDSSWCTTLTILGDNKLSGELPSCFTCHLLSYNVRYLVNGSGVVGGNNFTNVYPIPTCTTLIPNLRYNSDSQQLFLYGDDLGFYSSDIMVVSPSPSYVFIPLIYSKLFVAYPVFKIDSPQHIDLNFTGSNQVFTLSTIQKPPAVTLVTTSNQSNTMIFEGTFFNYNKSSIKILVGNNQCLTTSATFYKVDCLIQGIYDKNTIAQILIHVEDYYTTNLKILEVSIFAYLNQSTSVYNCSVDCSSLGGICNTLIGQCDIKCPNDCTLSGTCNTTTGICNCNANYQGSDCSLPFISCSSDCGASLNHGACNNQIGICECVPNYQGSNCTIPSHYITSVIPCSVDGGEVSIYGWFGNNGDGTHSLSSYNVLIGQLECTVTSINQTTIKCNLGAGKGTKSIKITNSNYPNVIFNGNGLFNYRNPIKTCPNSCTSSNNGKCNTNTGECQCNDKFTGFDCSTLVSIIETAPSTNTSVDSNTGGVTLTNENTFYEISIISLNEISISGSIVKSHQLKGNWSIVKQNGETIDPNIFKFSQTLINNTCTITYTIEEIKLKDKTFTFGTTTFTLKKDSLKLSVLLKDYQYQSSLNTLQLVFYSAAGTDKNSNSDDSNDCNKQETSINTSNADNQQLSNYIQIYKNSKILVGRFINQVVADSRPTFMSSTIINDNSNRSTSSSSSIVLGLNLPHCNECLIDPDFSILVSPNFKDSCDGSTNKNKWLIPVAVVVPVVGCAVIVILSVVLYKKYRYNIKLFAIKLKPFRK